MTHIDPSKPTITERAAEYRKAIAGFLVPALTVLAAALIPDTDGQVIVTATEWVGIVIAALGTSAIVAAVPNRAL